MALQTLDLGNGFRNPLRIVSQALRLLRVPESGVIVSQVCVAQGQPRLDVGVTTAVDRVTGCRPYR